MDENDNKLRGEVVERIITYGIVDGKESREKFVIRDSPTGTKWARLLFAKERLVFSLGNVYCSNCLVADTGIIIAEGEMVFESACPKCKLPVHREFFNEWVCTLTDTICQGKYPEENVDCRRCNFALSELRRRG